MARYTCERCGAMSNTLDPPHLCKDLAARLKRRERQVKAVNHILWDLGLAMDPSVRRRAAEDIVSTLARLGVTED